MILIFVCVVLYFAVCTHKPKTANCRAVLHIPQHELQSLVLLSLVVIIVITVTTTNSNGCVGCRC